MTAPKMTRAEALAELESENAKGRAPWSLVDGVLDAYRALPAVTGPWEARYSRSASLWVVSKVDGTTGHLGFSGEVTAQRYALALNVAEMNG